MGSSVSVDGLPESISLEECKGITGEKFDQMKWNDNVDEDDTVPKHVFIDVVARTTIETQPPREALLRLMNPRMKLEFNWETMPDMAEWTNVEVDEDQNVTSLDISSADNYQGLSHNLYELGNAILGPRLQTLNLSSNGRMDGNLMLFKNTPLLSTLNLARTQIIGDIRVFRYLPQLQFINLNSCRRVSGDVGVFEKCELLQRAQMNDCHLLAGNIAAFVNQSLKILDVSGCPRIGGDIACFAPTTPDPEKVAEADAELAKVGAVLEDREYYLNKAVERLKRKRIRDRIEDHLSAKNDAIQARRDYKAVQAKQFLLIGLLDVRLAGTEVEGDIAVFGGYPALEQLRLYETRVHGNIEVFESLPVLKVLLLYGRVLANVDKKPPQRKSRPDFPEQHKAIVGDVLAFRSTPKLEQLDLTGCSGVDGSIIAFEKCLELKVLKLKGTSLDGQKHEMETIKRTIPACLIEVESIVGAVNTKKSAQKSPQKKEGEGEEGEEGDLDMDLKAEGSDDNDKEV